MDRAEIINRIGIEYMTSNIEGGEYSYVQEAGSKKNLESLMHRIIKHFKVDIRFESEDVVVLVETKQDFKEKDSEQLKEYVEEEKILHPEKKIICILANTKDDKIRVWKDCVDEQHILKGEAVMDTMEHYKKLFEVKKQNSKETVLRNTYGLNELLHKKDISEKLRSQFVGTALIYIENVINKYGFVTINDDAIETLHEYWLSLSAKQIISGIKETIENLLDSTSNKEKKINIITTNVLENQKIQSLTVLDWVEILLYITSGIYAFIDTDSSDGQDIMNMFFITFNKYVGKADKNQAFTPDYITEFMCRLANINRDSVIFDATCGSGAFLVQALVKEYEDCKRECTEKEQKENEEKCKNNVYGIEIEENAYGLAITNMLLHKNNNANIYLSNLFESEDIIKKANADIYMMNPPFNANPKFIPEKYKKNWGQAKNGKTDPSKGLVFVQAVSDMVKNSKLSKEIRLYVLLPVSVAIGGDKIITKIKEELLKDNTLEAVFTLSDELFYPGASVSSCCMVFHLGKPHVNADGTINKTFFGYFKDDGHKKKKNIGRIEELDEDGNSRWKKIEEGWLSLYRNKEVEPGLSAMTAVTAEDEWLCEAYMESDYNRLNESLFVKSINNQFSYFIKNNRLNEVINIVKESSNSENKQLDLLSDNMYGEIEPTSESYTACDISSNEIKEPIELDFSYWKTFKIKDIFDKIEKGKCSNASALMSGNDINYIGAKWTDAGLMKSCEMEKDLVSYGNCIAMIGQGQGSSGYAMYHDKPFIGASSLNLGYAPWINFYTGIFVSTILCLEYDKYSFGRSWTGNRLLNTEIKLPVNKNGEIDTKYMERYIKNVIKKLR